MWQLLTPEDIVAAMDDLRQEIQRRTADWRRRSHEWCLEYPPKPEWRAAGSAPLAPNALWHFPPKYVVQVALRNVTGRDLDFYSGEEFNNALQGEPFNFNVVPCTRGGLRNDPYNASMLPPRGG